MGLPCYHKSILETGSVLKATDFDVHWFVDRQHFINPPALRLREPAVVHKAWKPAARRPKATSTARGSTRNVLTDRNDVGAGRPVGQPSDQGPIPGPSQAAVRALAPDRVSCGRKSQTACNTNNCSCRRANVLCGKWCHKGDTRCGNLKDAKLEAAQKGEYARQQTEKLSLVEQCLQQLTGVLHQSQVESAERAERAAPPSTSADDAAATTPSIGAGGLHTSAESHEDKAEDRLTPPGMAVRAERAALT
ncbi:hypothetical protein E4U11_003438 [Claviceps purpurea]|nr:hypothetical protein E4U11_003438 [Claviceps purpurea]